MTDRERWSLAKLSENIQKLKAMVIALEGENASLRQTLNDREQQLADAARLHSEVEDKNRKLLVARSLMGDAEGMQQAKVRLGALIKEVEKCISLIKTE